MMEYPDIGVRSRAAAEWTAWRTRSSRRKATEPRRVGDRPDDAKLAFVRICSHYFAHDGFLEDGVLIREASKLAGIPGVLIHGRNDLGGGACTPWELARAWPGAELIIIEDSGHTGSATMTDRCTPPPAASTPRSPNPPRPRGADERWLIPTRAPVRGFEPAGGGITACRPPGIPGAGFVLAQEFEGVIT